MGDRPAKIWRDYSMIAAFCAAVQRFVEADEFGGFGRLVRVPRQKIEVNGSKLSVAAILAMFEDCPSPAPPKMRRELSDRLDLRDCWSLGEVARRLQFLIQEVEGAAREMLEEADLSRQRVQ